MPTITYTPIPQVVYSGVSSSVTSPAYLVQDYNVISAFVVPGSNSTIFTMTIQASDDDGMQSAIVNWSTITSITSSGGSIGANVLSIAPGMRWLRFGSPISSCTVILAGNAF